MKSRVAGRTHSVSHSSKPSCLSSMHPRPLIDPVLRLLKHELRSSLLVRAHRSWCSGTASRPTAPSRPRLALAPSSFSFLQQPFLCTFARPFFASASSPVSDDEVSSFARRLAETVPDELVASDVARAVELFRLLDAAPKDKSAGPRPWGGRTLVQLQLERVILSYHRWRLVSNKADLTQVRTIVFSRCFCDHLGAGWWGLTLSLLTRLQTLFAVDDQGMSTFAFTDPELFAKVMPSENLALSEREYTGDHLVRMVKHEQQRRLPGSKAFLALNPPDPNAAAWEAPNAFPLVDSVHIPFFSPHHLLIVLID